MGYTQQTAETLGLQALSWLATNEELLLVFQGSSGVSAGDLREGARDPAFLGAVLDFIMLDDAWVVQCCDAVGVNYDSLMQARQVLPGGQQVNWT